MVSKGGIPGTPYLFRPIEISGSKPVDKCSTNIIIIVAEVSRKNKKKKAELIRHEIEYRKQKTEHRTQNTGQDALSCESRLV